MDIFNAKPRAAKPLSSSSKRLAVRFSGTVQGVGFRWTCRELANRLGLTGWVRNEYDGSVSLEIQGEPDDLALFFSGLTEQFDRRRFSLGFTIDEKVEIKTIAGEQDFAVVF